MNAPTPSLPSRRLSPRQQRLAWIVVGLTAIAIVVALVLSALRSNIVFFFTPTQVAADEAPKGRPFRIGGLVDEGSVKRDGLDVAFRVTDGAKTIPVVYRGTLPDLFKEGKGVVAQGTLTSEGTFKASEVLAKHDENYMPPEAAEALKKAGHPLQSGTVSTK